MDVYLMLFVFLPVSTNAWCRKSVLQITATVLEDKYTNIRLSAVYGDTVHVYCIGHDASNFKIELNGIEKSGELVNITTLKLTASLDVESHKFQCKDVKSNCTEALIVNVGPEMTVVSPNVSQTKLNQKPYFSVPVTEEYQIACLGSSNDLMIRQNAREIIESKIMNETTIISTKQKQTKEVFIDYHCYKKNTRYGETVRNVIRVYVDHVMNASNFWCVECEEQINCTWTAQSIYTTYTLFYMDDVDGGQSAAICEEHSRKNKRLCEWSMDDVWTRGLEMKGDFKSTLVLQACNRVLHCANETFSIDHRAIAKPPHPVNVIPVQYDRWYVVLLKMHTHKNVFGYKRLEYRITYRIPGIWPWETKIKLGSDFGSRENSEDSSIYEHIITFNIPCPDTLYEIRVRFKYYETPEEEKYWTEPYVFTFSSKPQEVKSYKNPHEICSREPELIDNGIIGAHEVRKLEVKFKREMRAFKEKVNALRAKREIVIKIMKEII